MKPLVAFLLLLGVLRHYGWELFRPEIQAQVWNIVGSVVIILFLIAIATRETLLVILWWIAEEAQAATCSTLWIIRPWEVKPGEAQCSALLGFDMGTLGLLAVATILVCQYARAYRSPKKETKA